MKARSVLAVWILAALGSLGPAPAHASTTAVVSMKDFAFVPASVSITAGDTVEWRYDESASDPMPNCESLFLQPPSPVTCPGHSTTAAANGPDGKPLWDSGVHRASGFPFRFTFTTPGTYHYICTVHGGAHKNNPLTNMEGDIVVNPGPTKVLGLRTGRSLPSTGEPVAGAFAFGLALAAAGAVLRIYFGSMIFNARPRRRSE